MNNEIWTKMAENHKAKMAYLGYLVLEPAMKYLEKKNKKKKGKRTK